MKAIYIVKEGPSDQAFEIREVPKPTPGPGQVLIAVEVFGLNFADVMARKGLYQDRPPLPSVVGYDVAGRIEAVGSGVASDLKGQRVTAMTRFGGYAEYVVTDARATAIIPDTMDAGVATALSTQYCTAWYAAEECVRLYSGDAVLIHAAAGGVGTALVQLALRRGATVFGTAGSPAKLAALKQAGVHYPIDYRSADWDKQIRSTLGKRGLDVVFDSIGGKTFRKGLALLGSGGRMVSYGAASLSDASNGIQRMIRGLGFGIYHPVQFLMPSLSLIGINMLRIADNRPEILERCLKAVVHHTGQNELKPVVGARFTADQIPKAHDFLESRQSSGKVVVSWK